MFQELLSGAEKKTVITAITLWTSNFCCSSKVRVAHPPTNTTALSSRSNFSSILGKIIIIGTARYLKTKKKKKSQKHHFHVITQWEFLRKLKSRPERCSRVGSFQELKNLPGAPQKRTGGFAGGQTGNLRASWRFSLFLLVLRSYNSLLNLYIGVLTWRFQTCGWWFILE